MKNRSRSTVETFRAVIHLTPATVRNCSDYDTRNMLRDALRAAVDLEACRLNDRISRLASQLDALGNVIHESY